MSNSETTAIELLKIALGTADRIELSHTPTEQEWVDIFKFANRQAITGVLFPGVEIISDPANPVSECQAPPRSLLMKWFGQIVAIRNHNEVLNVGCRKWTEYFEKQGFQTCILKGQSNACLYPERMVRNAGDIDILVIDPKAGNAFESRRNVISFVRGIWPSCVVQYHHIEIPPIDGVSVEIHYLPVVAFGYFTNRRMQQYFWERRNGCVCNPRGFCDYDSQANLIFQMCHIFKHLIIEGVGLRQIVDYFFLLKSTPKDVRDAAAAHLQCFGLKRFAGALMFVLQQCCGLEEEYFLVRPNQKVGKYLLDEILRGGNFGRYDNRFDKKAGGRIHNLLMISRIALRNFRYFPLESIQSPLGRAVSILWLKKNGYYLKH